MRIIDADALLENQPKGCYRTSDWINAAPTVPAIPVEWLRDMMLEREAEESRAAWLVMREWKKEQEGEIVANDKPLDIAKKIIKEHYKDYDWGIFNTPNIVGDPMETIYEDDSIEILGCYYYSYFEVFGLSRDDFDRLEDYYDGLEKEAR